MLPPSVLLKMPLLLPLNPDGLLERYIIEGFAGLIANEVTLGVTNPFMLSVQFRPASVLLYTALRVPEKTVELVIGLMPMEVTILLLKP